MSKKSIDSCTQGCTLNRWKSATIHKYGIIKCLTMVLSSKEIDIAGVANIYASK